MKVTVLGAGGAFATIAQGNSSFLVDVDHPDRKSGEPIRRILIDCGTTVPYVLRDEMGIPLQSITDVIVTHAHADHIGGLEQLLYSNKYMGKNPKPSLYTTRDVYNDVSDALTPGLCHSTEGELDVEDFVAVWWIQRPGKTMHVAGIPLTFGEVEHAGNMPASGLQLGPLVVSGDTNAPVSFYNDTFTHIFHEAEFGFTSGVHCPVELLRNTVSAAYRKKMWLYHYPAAITEAEGFAGLLKKGDVFNLEAHVDD